MKPGRRKIHRNLFLLNLILFPDLIILKGDTFVILPGSQRSYCVWIIRSKAAEKGIAKIKKNEYQRNIKVMPRGLVLGQNICSPGAGHSFSSSPMPTAPKCIFCTGSQSRALPVPHKQQRADVQPGPTGWVGEEWFAPYVKEKRQDLMQELFFFICMSTRTLYQ